MSHDDVKICRLIADIATKPIMETVVNMTLIRFAATADTVYTFMKLLSVQDACFADANWEGERYTRE